MTPGLHTFEQIAAMQGVSRARIQQIERRAFRKFRQAVERYATAAGVSPREWLMGEGRDEPAEDAA